MRKKIWKSNWLKMAWGGVLLLPALSFHNLTPTPLPDPETVLALYPKEYFKTPVDDVLRLSGTFGELRPDHFHSGIDLSSSTGRVGQPVYAAADGFIDAVKVQSGGYGNVLYIKHPNGYTTVYAHLDHFSPQVERYVREVQYKRERYEIELKPQDGFFKVKQGEEIGKMGNTGSSSGPHLHFEIRHSATGKAVNPLLFGLPVADRVPPVLRDMKVYVLDDQRRVLDSKPFPIERRKDGTYGIKGDTARIGAWRVGFGIKTFDKTNLMRNDNGVYAIALSANDQLMYQWRMDELDFDESRYLNAHIDYPARQNYGAWFHRCFVLPGDRLSNYSHTESLGAIALSKDQPTKITLKVTDASGNIQTITFWALRDENMASITTLPYQFELPFNADSRIDLDGFTLVMPKGALYEDLHFQYKTTPDDSHGVFSTMHHLHDNAEPVHKYFEIAIAPYNLPEGLRQKAIVARCGAGRPDNCGGSWRDGRLVTRVRAFGDYCIMADTEPPAITPIVFGADLRRKGSMSFRIRDNFDASGQADEMSYRGTIDGQWVLFAYDKKSRRLTHVFDSRTGPGEHLLRLAVKDDCGNEGIFEKKFVR